MHLKIAARKSDLARLQAYEVGRKIKELNPQITVEYLFSTSLGDQNLEDPLWKMPEKGVFTADLTEKLKRGECDLVVHSWKDLPTELAEPVISEIVATLPRADVRDLFLFKKTSFGREKLNIFTSSPRRAYNLGDFFKWALPFDSDVEFLNVRGNISTRVKKLIEGEADGLVVAKAAIDRLLKTTESEFAETRRELRAALEKCAWMVVPLSASPTAPAQGALAIEILKNRSDLRDILASINCSQTFSEVNHERKVFKAYGGGCHQKIGLISQEKPYGRIDFGRGKPPTSEAFSYIRLEPKIKRNITTVSQDLIFPLSMKDSVFFSREKLHIDIKKFRGRNLWVARADAWPENLNATEINSLVIWTSGLETWRKLATRGVWVSGTNDSMGEREPADIDTLLGQEPKFLKLTHEAATEIESSMQALATYRLVPSDNPPNLAGKTHFFWASYSIFARALELAPSIIQGHHACGPGHSYDLIYAELRRLLPSETARLDIYISRESWLDELTTKG